MVFHIKQTHTPELCPVEIGGSEALYNEDVDGIKLIAIYGAFSEHIVYYIVETESIEALNQFLAPGWKRCNTIITPVFDY